MVNCKDMKVDQVYYCSDCGLELKVVKESKECKDPDHSHKGCCCSNDNAKDEHDCEITCCGHPMEKK